MTDASTTFDIDSYDASLQAVRETVAKTIQPDEQQTTEHPPPPIDYDERARQLSAKLFGLLEQEKASA